MRGRSLLGSLSVSVAALVAGCSAPAWSPTPSGVVVLPAPPPRASGASSSAPTPTELLAARVESAIDELVELSPSLAREAGLHAQGDGRIADASEAGLAKRAAVLDAIVRDLESSDVAEPGSELALDRGIVLAHARLSLFRLRELDEAHRSPLAYQEPFAVNDYLDRDYAPKEERVRALLAHERAGLAAAKHARANLRGPLPRHAVETAIRAYRGYATYLRTDAPKLTAGVGDAELQREVTTSHDALARAADDLASWLEKSELPRADLSHALGEARFLGFVRAQEGIAVDVKTFRADAEADLAKNRSAFEAERKKKGAALVRPKASELLPLATAMADESRAFVVGKGLVSIPSADGAVVKETPPFMRYNSAFLSAPGAFEKPGLLAFYYITPPDPTWPKREQNEYLMPRGTLLSTTVHEVVPGHFLQALFVRRAPTRAQRLFGSYSFVEGWAHYAEEMMLEEGFGASEPSARAGQLADALLRNCRWTGAIELHVDRRKVSDVAKRFERECGQDAASAREQAARGTFDPGYFAYTFGKRELFALRAELKRRLGNRFDLRTFHDAVLSHGAPPLPLLRDRVLRDLAPID